MSVGGAARERFDRARAARLCKLDRAAHERAGNPAPADRFINEQAADREDAVAVPVEDG